MNVQDALARLEAAEREAKTWRAENAPTLPPDMAARVQMAFEDAVRTVIVEQLGGRIS